MFDYAKLHISMTINKHPLSFLPEATGRNHLEKTSPGAFQGSAFISVLSQEKSSTKKKNNSVILPVVAERAVKLLITAI